jgi:hypothetical protein
MNHQPREDTMQAFPTARTQARAAAMLYLLVIAAGVFAEMFVRGSLVVPAEPAATARNILASESLFRWGLIADNVMLVAYVAVTLLFYSLFRNAGVLLSRMAACLSLVGISVLAADGLTHLAALVLLEDTTLAASGTGPSLALDGLRLHGVGYVLANFFFGAYCVLVGHLAAKSGRVPRMVGYVLSLGGLAYLAGSMVTLGAPALAHAMPDLTAIGGLAELAFALWLLVRAVPERVQSTDPSASLAVRIGEIR